MMTDGLIAFYSARLDEAERTVYAEGTPPHGVIAWLTYCEPDGSMIYATVAHGDTAGGPWFAAGKELPEPANVLVVYDPARSLRHIAAGRAVIKRYELAAAAGAKGSVSAFVHGQDDGYAEACLDAIRDGAAAWDDHADCDPSWRMDLFLEDGPVSERPWMHVNPAQIPTDLKEPATDAGYPPETDCPHDVTTPGWPDRYRAWTIQEMRRNGWSIEGLARVFGLTPFGIELYLRKETRG